jgi:transcription antitermination factor NusG
MKRLEIGDRVEAAERPAKAISPDDRRKWYAIQSEPSSETLAEKEIGKLGYLVYVPRFTLKARDRSSHRKVIEVKRPLFKRYLFARLAPAIDPVGSIMRCRGVTGFVRLGEKSIAVPDTEIERLQHAEGGNFDIPYTRTKTPIELDVGDVVRATAGPFAGFTGELIRLIPKLDGPGRIVALFHLFGRLSEVELEADQVEGA